MARLIESELWPVFSQLTPTQVNKALENMRSAMDDPHASMPHVVKRPMRAMDLGIDDAAWHEVLSFFHSDTTQPKPWLDLANSLVVVVQKTESGLPGFFLQASDSAKLIDVVHVTRGLEEASNKDKLIEKWNDMIASATAVYCLQKVDEFADQSLGSEKASSLQLNYVSISDLKMLEVVRSLMPDQIIEEARFVIIDRAIMGEMQYASIIRFSVKVEGQDLLIGLNGKEDVSLEDIVRSLQDESGSILLFRSVADSAPVLIDYSSQN